MVREAVSCKAQVIRKDLGGSRTGARIALDAAVAAAEKSWAGGAPTPTGPGSGPSPKG
jgi:hypothetical protein